MRHYLITQWNVDLYDLGWLQRRQKVFEKYTLPSVEGQFNKNFEWILISDSRTPDKFKNVLDRYPARTIYYDFEHYNWTVPSGKFEPVMARSIRLEVIGDVVAEIIGKQTVPVITSRLDNDDLLAKEHMQRIRQYATELWESKGPKFWLSLVRGYRLKEGKIYPFNSKCNAFVSFVEDPNNLKTAYQCCHTVANRTPYPLEIIRQGEPTWAEVVHGENVLNRVKRWKGERPLNVNDYRRFNINGCS